MTSKKHKNICKTLNYIEKVFILDSAITGCISISAFASLFGIPTGIASSEIRLKMCAILSYCLKCKNNTASKNPKVLRIKNRRIMTLSKCKTFDSKK